jgi:hypothetical protein
LIKHDLVGVDIFACCQQAQTITKGGQYRGLVSLQTVARDILVYVIPVYQQVPDFGAFRVPPASVLPHQVIYDDTRGFPVCSTYFPDELAEETGTIIMVHMDVGGG